MMVKRYLKGIKQGVRTDPGRGDDFYFTPDREQAYSALTKDEADSDCCTYNSKGVEIDSSDSGTYICRNFRSEERRAHEFVVFCEAPFIINQESR